MSSVPVSDRQRWLAILAQADPADLESALKQFNPFPQFERLIGPEIGLFMTRGRIGGTGHSFNLGEVSVARCTIRSSSDRIGTGYVLGRNGRHEPDNGEFASYLKLHTGAQIVSDRSAADFVAVTEPEPEYGFEHLRIGTDETPHLSATLLLQVKSFQNGTPVRLSGPGIKGSTTLLVKGLSSGFFERRSSFRFPRGVDIFFIANQQLVGLPRTTIAEVKY
jgi:hypothetical protein